MRVVFLLSYFSWLWGKTNSVWTSLIVIDCHQIVMARSYTRKKEARSGKPLHDVITAVRTGHMNVLSASKTYNIPRSTLILHLKGWKGRSVRCPPKHNNAGRPSALTHKDEETIAMCVRMMGKWGFGISHLELLETVKDYVLKNKITTPFKDGKPGEDWYLGFMKRHQLSLKKPEKVETSRMKQTDPFIV